jgi:1-carboxybiuret hydrolase
MDTAWAHASEIAAAVADGRTSASAVVRAALARIAADNPVLNAFTAVLEDRALAKARAIDAARLAGNPLGALAGVPFAVKNLFDVAGLPTLAGSKINCERAPAPRDATLIARLEANGAVLVGALNMGEYAYDFTGENVHYGPSRNPHDVARMTGGSSGGSGGAVAGGLVPLALGSDTNGSIRVPASLCGVFGLKPTFGRLSRAHTFPFVASLDHLGPFARSTRDLALAYDAMQGHDGDDPACASRSLAAISAPAFFPRRKPRSPALPPRSARPRRSSFRRPNVRAPRPMSSPQPKGARFTSRDCARARTISILPCATV